MVTAAAALIGFGGVAAANAQSVPAATTDGKPTAVREQEPATSGGRNDTPATAQAITGFGTAAGRGGEARISGTLALPTASVVLPPAQEDNGAVDSAVDTRLQPGRVVRTTGTIGDGPHGSAGDSKGDFDVYVIHGARQGQLLSVFVDTPGSDLHPTVQYSGAAVIDGVASKDKGSSLFTQSIESDGDMFLVLGGEGSQQSDPTDSGSGNGAKSEGAYTVTFALESGDTDLYAVDLAAGDVLSGAVSGGAARLQVFDTARKLAVGSMGNGLDELLPKTSPLARGGNASLNHIAARAGRYYVAVSGGQGRYDVTVKANRPGPETKKATQTIFIDVDGAKVNPAIFPGSTAKGVRKLSPLSAFTDKWGITTKAQRDALVDRIITTVTENLQGDFAGTGSKVRILNSRDHKDPFGQPNVSRIVIGGTVQELGVSGAGISQSVDPGNFFTEDTALALMDALSAPGGERFSLNTYLKANSDRVRFVGTAIANLASHEAGHSLGLYHSGGQTGDKPNLMVHGIAGTPFGEGPDDIGGTADDVDVDFQALAFGADTGFTGTEDCRTRLRWALS